MRRWSAFAKFSAAFSLMMGPLLVSAMDGVAIPKEGSCPSRYSSRDGYCVPGKGAAFAVKKDGSCPTGYVTSGSYCLARDGAGHALFKSGSCPGGYVTSGKYCVQQKAR